MCWTLLAYPSMVTHMQPPNRTQPHNYTQPHPQTTRQKARRQVLAARLTYDAERSKLKNASATSAERVRLEMEASEDEFVACVDDAMGKMKAVVERSDLIKCLTDLASAQRTYFKLAAQALEDLVPELEELVVTNEALASGS